MAQSLEIDYRGGVAVRSPVHLAIFGVTHSSLTLLGGNILGEQVGTATPQHIRKHSVFETADPTEFMQFIEDLTGDHLVLADEFVAHSCVVLGRPENLQKRVSFWTTSNLETARHRVVIAL